MLCSVQPEQEKEKANVNQMPTQDIQDWLDDMDKDPEEEGAKTLSQRRSREEKEREIKIHPFPLAPGEVGLAKSRSYFNGEK